MSRLPSTTWQMLAERPADRELPRGLDAAWDAVAGMLVRLRPRRAGFMSRAARILTMEKPLRDLSDAHLREQAAELRQRFRFARDTPEDLDRGYAVVSEVASRQIGLRPFQVQLAGALALEAGCIVEMATGEGKTLTATLPATIGGWRGRGCHVVTVNDYLAGRDAEWMKPLYQFCGLSVAAISQGMHPPERRAAYQADITYCTNKEVTADFLRDRLSLGRLQGLPSALMARIVEGAGSGTDRLVQRGLATAIIDEADSVLIDEAVTPLIISGDAPNPEQVEAFRQAVALADQLEVGR
ncbi:MAG: prepilin peptidase, partial [Planctomycetota bacterium]|nr:prepilin peptidase [Planctomycetota bacterium]